MNKWDLKLKTPLPLAPPKMKHSKYKSNKLYKIYLRKTEALRNIIQKIK